MNLKMIRTTDAAGRSVEASEKAAAVLARKPVAVVKVPAAVTPRTTPNLHPLCKPTPLPAPRTLPDGRFDQARLF